MRAHPAVLVPLFMVAVACGTHHESPTAPPGPQALPPGAQAPGWPDNGTMWTGKAALVSVLTEDECGRYWRGLSRRASVDWGVVIGPQGRIELDEDLSLWPTDNIHYDGVLDGRRFSASSPGLCPSRLEGEFNGDFTAFEARETVGSPSAIVVLQWHASRH